MKKYTEEQLVERRNYYKKWRKNHKEQLRLKAREQYQKHKITIRKNFREKYAREKLDKDNSKLFIDRNNLRFKNKIKALQKVSGKLIPECCICGETDPRILTINHKYGDPTREKYKYGNMALAVTGGRKVEDLDVRCFNCNILYEFERNKRGPKNWKELYNNLISES